MTRRTSFRALFAQIQWRTIGLGLLAPFFIAEMTYAQDAMGLGTGFEPRAAKLLADNCYGCHGHEEPSGGLDLAHFRTIESMRQTPEVWKKVMRRVINGSMPPEESNPLPGNEKEYFSKWVDSALHDIKCSEVAYPGHVTIRRLNRLEYRNSVRDLLGVDYEPAASFPGDDTGYGFDNIGDVLSLPPMLLEKYLDAAESISRQVIPAPEDSVPLDQPLEMSKWKSDGAINAEAGVLSYYSKGSATFDLSLPRAEEVTIRIRARGDQAGDEPVKMLVFHNKKKLAEQKVPNDTVDSFDFVTRVPKGNSKLRISFENDFYDPKAADPSARDRNLIVETVTLIRPKPANEQSAELRKKFLFVEPKSKADEAAAAKRILSVWSSRFFRRPVNATEVERLFSIYDAARRDKESYEKSLQYALQALLVSPKFLYKVEQPPAADGKPSPLSSFELATSLSYFLWATTPDSELLKTGLSENLQNDAVLRKTAERMLRDDKSKQLSESFAVQWLQLRGLATFEPDPKQFDGADQKLLADMRRETVMFFQEMIREDRSVLGLLAADFSYVNRRLAKHYGLAPEPKDDKTFERISLVGTNRGGLLTQGSVLAVTSNPTRTSPVKRGKWIMENLLGDAPPPPLPDVMPLEQQKLSGSLREQMEQHRRDPNCASCHEVMDQLGFALENFDAVGRWRTKDAGGEVDASGKLPTGEEFRGADELRKLLLNTKKKEFVRCLTEKMLIYALGRGLRYEDQCAVNEITTRLEKNEYRFSELVYGIVESKPFRQRQLPEKEQK